MAILASDIKLLKSERMTDLEDSGGYPSNLEALDNVDNNVFPDISSGDRVTGRAQARLIYGSVRSPDTDTYMGARFYLLSPPTDAAVDTVIFPVVSGTNQAGIFEPVYRYASKGANSNYRLYAQVGIGSDEFVLYACTDSDKQSARPTKRIKAGDTLIFEDVTAGSFQTVQVKEFVSYGGDGTLYTSYYFKTAKPFTAVFNGAFYTDAGHINYLTPTQVYFANPIEIPIYGLRVLEETANSGVTSVKVTNNDFLLAPQVGYPIDAAIKPEGYGEGLKTFSYTTSSGGTGLALPVIGGFNHLKRVTWPVAGNGYGAWNEFDIDLVSTTSFFIVNLPNYVPTSTWIIYYTADDVAGTAFIFRLNAPAIPSSLHLLAVSTDSTVITGTDNGTGTVAGTNITSGTVDYDTGLVELVLAKTCNKENVTLSYQYTTYIDSMSADEIGIDSAKLPSNKIAPLFRIGDSVLVHYTTHQTLTNPVVSNTTYTLNRANVDQVWLEDATGTRIPTAKYTINLVTASVTMGAALDLSGYSQPLEAYTTLQDEVVIVEMATDGQQLHLNRALTHTYPNTTGRVSSILKAGDLAAAVSVPFAQQAWTSVWSNSLIGNAITPQYNHVVYPLVIMNNGAITERWRIQFTSTTLINLIGEKVGQIATGLSITSDIAPINPYTSTPYFTIDKDGWGAGWVSGNLLRFNTIGADAAIGCLRVVQPSVHVPGATDRFRLTFLGDVNA